MSEICREPHVETADPFGEEKPIKLTIKTLLWIIGGVAVAVASWVAIKNDVSSLHQDVNTHTIQLQQISQQLSAVEMAARSARDTATAAAYQQALMNQQFNSKLDYLTSDRRGPRPSPTPQ